MRELEFVWRKVRSRPVDVLPAVKRRLRFRQAVIGEAKAPADGDLVGLYAEVHAHGAAL